jgi:glycosyltransferase involved in cell wall biosynthesis
MMDNSSEKTKPYISVVSPVYGCESSLYELYQRLSKTLSIISLDYQIILVNDQSPDQSWSIIQKIAQQDSRVLGLNMSRNFGQHPAITAGLDRAEGEWVVVMDCDLQDVPEEIPNLHKYALENELDIVFARRARRNDSLIKKLSSHLFHIALDYLSGTKQDPATANFGIFNKRVIAALCSLREPIRAFPVQIKWLGFRRGSLNVRHASRLHGESGYSFGKQINLALNIILAFSDKPLRLAVKLGIVISLLALLFTAYIVLRSLFGGYSVSGYASLMASIWFLSGLLMFVSGIIGLYISKIFEGVKNRPLYILQAETPKNI